MKRALLILMTVFGLVVASPAMADTKTIQITGTGFVPAHLAAVQGDTVTFNNVDTASHQVVADDGTFASLTLKTGESYSVKVATVGTVKYHDTLSKNRGDITVKAAPVPTPTPTVTLQSSAATAVYGGTVTLRGTISTNQSGESVSLLAQEAGQPKSTQAIKVATTGSGGAFSFTVNPTIRTAYAVQYKTASSQDISVLVAPSVTLRTSSSRIFHAGVDSDASYRGHYVLFQRLNGLGSWVTAKKVVLGSSGTAAFRATLPKGRTRVRLLLPMSQAGFGYVAGHSLSLLVRR